METTLGSMDEKCCIVNCPTCYRVMWAHGTCQHGQVPEPSKDAPKEPGIDRNYKGRRK